MIWDCICRNWYLIFAVVDPLSVTITINEQVVFLLVVLLTEKGAKCTIRDRSLAGAGRAGDEKVRLDLPVGGCELLQLLYGFGILEEVFEPCLWKNSIIVV